jgi:hypothetical protein
MLCDIDMALLECSKESLYDDVINRSSFAVHGYLYVVLFEQLCVLIAGVLTPLI